MRSALLARGRALAAAVQMLLLAPSSAAAMQAARVQPDRRWFGNTRVVGQQELQDFREQVAQTAADPYAVLLRRHKLPMGLLKDGNIKKGRVDLLRAQSYAEAFGRRAQRKRPRHSAVQIVDGDAQPNDLPRTHGACECF